ncbi:MAG: DinB family protein [Bacteroidetes bacterium]|nr:DinB family protein [Bacteroidota bacterium]
MPTTKEILLTQFAACYTEENWFNPLTNVLSDLTDEEFIFKDNAQDHSIKELIIHLTFWNERYFHRFKGTPLPPIKFEGTDITFDDNGLSKDETLKKFYAVMDDFLTELENAPQERFDEKAFKEPERSELWWEIIHNINIHNAYHLGQIMMIKKKFRS